jgi:hypothetical protein
MRHCGLDPQSIENQPQRYAIARRAFTKGKALDEVKKERTFFRFNHIFDTLRLLSAQYNEMKNFFLYTLVEIISKTPQNQ